MMLIKKDILKNDRSEMYKVYDNWPQIAKDSFKKDIVPYKKKFTHFVFAGMGGSGTISDIFAAILSKTNVHVDVIKGYNLPKTANKNTLVIVTSVSGNTSETLSILKSAKKRGCSTISFSSGGNIEKFCLKNSLEFRKIDVIHSPRASLTIYLYSMLKVLLPIIPLKKNEVLESIQSLDILKRMIYSKNTKNNKAMHIAKWITNIPVIYYPWGLQSAAIRFKNSLQENAKMHVITEDVIEACHNGIVPWSKEKNMKVIIIQGTDDNLKTKERWKVLKEFFRKENIKYFEIKTTNGGILKKLIHLIYMLDYVSIYKAMMMNIDPTPVEPIDIIKKKINN